MKVLGVGRIQSDPITEPIDSNEKLALNTEGYSTQIVGSSDLAVPITRSNPDDVKAEEAAIGMSDTTSATEDATTTAAVASTSTATSATSATSAPTASSTSSAAAPAAKAESSKPAAATPTLVADDSSSGEWLTGLASAYGRSAGRNTATGAAVTDNSTGVAVPVSQRYLVGKTIEVKYGGMTITTVVNDTGGFESLGRALDLQPGVWKYFGFSSEDAWGVRTVQYRIID
ncbi:MAG: RlpA-like double-psi beta-barrel domain-containing protein [Coriobacteriia bacterium]|nr:RlpA-like double-psi beta-barrel domain-containing protein [Coriobacteriia bacterium]